MQRIAGKPPSLTVVGSVNLDLVARMERLPRPGETVTGAAFERHPGGKGANQAVAAARLGAAVRFVGCVGDDDFAEEALAGLREAGVQLEVRRARAPTGVALIYVDQGGETEIAVAPGANAALSPQDVDVTAAEAVLCQLEIPISTVNRAAAQAARFFLNAAPAHKLPRRLLRRAEVVVVNALELEEIEEDARRELLLAVTLGEDGAALLRHDRAIEQARPPKVRAVDGTAAGDAFAACLVVSLLEGRDREDALRRACAAGALAASRPGAQPSLPTADEVEAILG